MGDHKRKKMNGHTHGTPAKAKAKVDVINLTDGEQQEIRGSEDNVKQAKFLLADLTVQRLVVEAEIVKATQILQQAQAIYIDGIRKVAVGHGVDPDADPEVVGRWNLDMGDMRLKRVA